MKLLNERAQVREVAGLWEGQYCRGGYPYRLADGRNADDILAALKSLDLETATVADVDAAGARGWVAPKKCHECGCESWGAVELGEPPDYESCTATICERCLMKALRMIEASRYDVWRDIWEAVRGRQSTTPETP